MSTGIRRAGKGPGGGRSGLTIVDQPAAPIERADARLNRERILKAARKMLRRGAGELCMDALADQAGVGKGTLYRRFPDRAALVHALLDEDSRELQARALAGFDLPAAAGHVEHALVLLGALFDFSVEHADLLCEAQAGHRVAVRFDHPSHAWQSQLLAGHLRAAVRAKQVPPFEEQLVAEMLLATISPDLLRWLVERTPRAVLKRELLAFARGSLRSAE